MTNNVDTLLLLHAIKIKIRQLSHRCSHPYDRITSDKIQYHNDDQAETYALQTSR